MPYTNRTQTPLFSCRRNINFCLIRTLNRQKLHKVQIFGLIVCWFLSLVVPANMMCSQGNATQWISTVWIKVLCKTRNRAWPFPLESVRPSSRFQWTRIPMEKAMFYSWETDGVRVVQYCRPDSSGHKPSHKRIPMQKRVVQYCQPDSSGHRWIPM